MILGKASSGPPPGPPPVIDTHGHAINSTTTSISLSVSAAAAGEIVLVAINVGSRTSANPTLSISSATLVWTQLLSVSTNLGTSFGSQTVVWYAISAAAVTETVTVSNAGVTYDDAAILYASYSGQGGTPFDPNATLVPQIFTSPAVVISNNGSGPNEPSTIISTTNTNDVVFGLVASHFNNLSGGVANTPFSIIESAFNPGGTFNFAEIVLMGATVTSPQTNLTTQFNDTLANGAWIIAAFALTSG